MREYDYANSVAVTRDIHWVGKHECESRLHCNPYLLVDDEDVVLFDPGSLPDFPVIMRKVIDLVDPQQISRLVVSHQDPDVCGSLALIEDVVERKDLKIYLHSETARLVSHYGLTAELVRVDLAGNACELSSGRRLQFIPTPFLHSPGAIATFDPASGSLFTSDLFGGISREDWQLFATRDDLEGIAAFHRLYMPGNEVLRKGLAALRALPIQRILPQHGAVLEGELIEEVFAMLEGLACGLDLVEEAAS